MQRKEVFRYLFETSGKSKVPLFFLMLLQAVYGGSGVLYALLLRGVVSAAQEKEEALFWHYLLLTVLLSAAQLLVRALIRYLEESARSRMENSLKDRLLGQLLEKEYACVSAVHSAEWLNRLTNDTAVVSGSFIEIFPRILGMLVKLVSALIMLIAMEARFAAVLIPGGAFFILLTYAFRRLMKRLHRKVQEEDGRLRVFLQERISSMLLLRAFSAEDQTREIAGERMVAHRDAKMTRSRVSSLSSIGFGGAIQGLFLLGIFWCGYGILTGKVSFGTMTAVTQLITQIQAPFAGLTGYLPRFYAMIASSERLMEIEKYPGTSVGSAKSPEEIQTYYEKEFSGLALSHVDFSYYPVVKDLRDLTKEGSPKVLRDFSMEIWKGQMLGISGESGLGKTTVLKLIMGVYDPDAGTRLLYNKDGSSEELTADYRRLFAYVPQKNLLMNGTIREVVMFAQKTYTGEEAERKLWEALRISCAEEFVQKLEKKLDTPLGEMGTGLSEGQMQRLSVARALYSGSPILLLDEATSALDENTEMALLRSLKKLTDKTVVLISHRPEALSVCDSILHMHQGENSCLNSQ